MAPGAARFLLAALPLVAILFPAASASASSSPPVAGLSPAASASSSPPVITSLCTDASASRSPPVVARTSLTACASSSPRVTNLSTDASASTSPPVVTRCSPTACASSSRPVITSLCADASASTWPPVVTRFSPTACASSSPLRATARGAAPVWSSATPASVLPNSASSESIRGVRSASASPGSATTTAVDAEAQRARSATISLRAATTPTSTSSSSSPGRMLLILSVVAAILAAAGGWAARGGSDGEQQRAATDDYCEVCFVKKAVFLLECCKKPVCNFCLRDFVRNHHEESCKRLADFGIVPLLHPHEFGIGSDVPESYAHLPQYPPWYFATSVKKNSRLHLFYYHLQELEGGADPRVMEVIHLAYSRGELSAAIQCDIQPTMRPFSEL